MRVFAGLCLCVPLLVAGPVAAAKSADDSLYSLLRSIPTPQELVYPHFPKAYRVAVAMSGPMAEEMRTTLAGFGAANAQFEEVFENRQSRLEVANPDYTYETRELVCGILNPVAMTDVVLASFIRYRNDQELKTLLKETLRKRTVLRSDGRTRLLISFTPRGERFAYRYQDKGSHVLEAWLIRMDVEIDSAAMNLRSITMVRQSRVIDAAQTVPALVESAEYRYTVAYDTTMGVTMPVQLTMERDKKAVLAIRAAYRREKDRIVFSHRSICMSVADGMQQCLDISYGAYRFSTGSTVAGNRVIKNDAMAQQMKQAAKLLREVRDDLTKGNVDQALGKLNECVDRYGQTPQALEARRLLQGLPAR